MQADFPTGGMSSAGGKIMSDVVARTQRISWPERVLVSPVATHGVIGRAVDGDTVWTPGGLIPNVASIRFGDRSFYVICDTGADTTVRRYLRNGEMAWSYTIPDLPQPISIGNLWVPPEGGILAGAVAEHDEDFIYCFDKDGNLSWSLGNDNPGEFRNACGTLSRGLKSWPAYALAFLEHDLINWKWHLISIDNTVPEFTELLELIPGSGTYSLQMFSAAPGNLLCLEWHASGQIQEIQAYSIAGVHQWTFKVGGNSAKVLGRNANGNLVIAGDHTTFYGSAAGDATYGEHDEANVWIVGEDGEYTATSNDGPTNPHSIYLHPADDVLCVVGDKGAHAFYGTEFADDLSSVLQQYVATAAENYATAEGIG